MHANLTSDFSNKSTRIASLNVAGAIAGKTGEKVFIEYVAKRADIVFLSECKSKGKWKFADCKCVRKDRKKGVGGGIAFCIAPEFREYCVERTCSIPGVLVLEVKLKVARSDGGSKNGSRQRKLKIREKIRVSLMFWRP